MGELTRLRAIMVIGMLLFLAFDVTSIMLSENKEPQERTFEVNAAGSLTEEYDAFVHIPSEDKSIPATVNKKVLSFNLDANNTISCKFGDSDKCHTSYKNYSCTQSPYMTVSAESDKPELYICSS